MKIKSVVLVALSAFATSAMAADVINHKSPYCGCCGEWTKHMQDAGFNVTEELHKNMDPIKQKYGITPKLASCHTAVINGYVFEGHIPAADIEKFLENPPKNAVGLAVPGMPMGSPGMEYGDEKHEYVVYAFNKEGQVFEFNRYLGK